MKKNYVFVFLLLLTNHFISQNYTSYFTGNTNDTLTHSSGGICLMGGAGENDEAMKWFLNRANEGDVLILRASGANGYNNYFYSQLGVTLNSVETIVFNNASASNEAYIWDKINKAEAIWFAGGDQWNYISYWRNTAIDSLINKAIIERNIVIGGTSAGMAIQGDYYFSAQNGSVTTATALNNPYANTVTPDGTPFLNNAILNNTITDTHFDNPDRRGRLTTFMARIFTDQGVAIRAIACEEYAAVCIDENGIAKVYGEYPIYDEAAYFIQKNCDINNNTPENCVAGQPLTWHQNGEALLVYKINGTPSANNSFDLNNWKTASGGNWLYWSANNGVFSSSNGSAPNCNLSSIYESTILEFNAFINNEALQLTFNQPFTGKLTVYDLKGKVIESKNVINTSFESLSTNKWSNGLYIVHIENNNDKISKKINIFR